MDVHEWDKRIRPGISKDAKRWGGWNAKYEKVWTLEMRERVITAFLDGASIVEVVAIMGISRSTFYQWLKADDKQDFTETIRRGVEVARAWWMSKGRESLENGNFNSRTFELMMRNVYGWSSDAVSEQVPYIVRGSEDEEAETLRETVDIARMIRKAKESTLNSGVSRAEVGAVDDHADRARNKQLARKGDK